MNTKDCRHCGEEIYGGKGDWFHREDNSAHCRVLAEPEPTQYVYVVEIRKNHERSCGDDATVMAILSTEELAWKYCEENEGADSDFEWWWFEIYRQEVDAEADGKPVSGYTYIGQYYPLKKNRSGLLGEPMAKEPT